MFADMKELMEQFTEFGISRFPAATNVQVGLSDSLPEEFLEKFDAGEDFPHELLDVFRKSNGLFIQALESDNVTIANRLVVFDWDTFGDVDEMHEEMGFIEKYDGVYTIGTYNDLLVLVDTLGIHGQGKQAVFVTEKENLMKIPAFTGARNLSDFFQKVLRAESLPTA